MLRKLEKNYTPSLKDIQDAQKIKSEIQYKKIFENARMYEVLFLNSNENNEFMAFRGTRLLGIFEFENIPKIGGILSYFERKYTIQNIDLRKESDIGIVYVELTENECNSENYFYSFDIDCPHCKTKMNTVEYCGTEFKAITFVCPFCEKLVTVEFIPMILNVYVPERKIDGEVILKESKKDMGDWEKNET